MLFNRWGGLQPLGQLRDEIDRRFASLFGERPTFSPRFVGARSYPALNVWEEGDRFFAEAEIPGLKNEDLEISVVGDELTIKGERKAPTPEGVAYHRRERGDGKFTRVIHLPTEIDAARVQATIKDGVLLIMLPKSEAAKPRKIEVRATE